MACPENPRPRSHSSSWPGQFAIKSRVNDAGPDLQARIDPPVSQPWLHGAGRKGARRIFPGKKTVGKKTVSLNWAIFLKALDGW